MADEENVPNPYHKVIDILTNGPLNYKAITHTLAKHFPDVFLRVNSMVVEGPERIIHHEGYEVDTSALWYAEAYEISQRTTPPIGGGMYGKIAAIKKVREATNMGLKEAKDFVELFLV